MRIKPLLTTVVGLAIASGSVYLVKDRIQFVGPNTQTASTADLVEIYVARAEIGFGQTIENHLIAKQPWPREALPLGAFQNFEDLVPADRTLLRKAKARLFPGEVIIASKVSSHGEKVTLVQKLGENTRAMAIKVDAVTAVGGFVTPGDFVDIVLTQGSGIEMRAVTILQKVRVIGVDQQAEEVRDQPEIARTITVEVTPDQGQRLALAQKAGTLSLTLRTLDGVEDKPMDVVRLNDLLQNDSPIEEERAIQPTVTVRRGTVSEEVTIKRSPQTEPEAPAQKQVVVPVPLPSQILRSLTLPQVAPIKTSQVPSKEGI